MYEFAKYKREDKEFVFNFVSAKKGIHKAIVEKDFWVCLILDYLFNESKYKDAFVFKGGTSLSKGFQIINRFSEDVDLILDWCFLGVGKDEPLQARSNTKQDEYNEHLGHLAEEFIADAILADLKENFSALLGENLEFAIDERNKQEINFFYPRMYDIQYVKPQISLEIGPLAAWTPSKEISISPYIAEIMPNALRQKETKVLTVLPQRTFWEKATILHSEAHRDLGKQMPTRYSRHYYDVYQFSKTPYLESSLKDRELLEKVIRFKNKFYRTGWACYDDCLIGKFRLIPDEKRFVGLRKDYAQMSEMIYGEIPTFDDIVDALQKLEEEINYLIPNQGRRVFV